MNPQRIIPALLLTTLLALPLAPLGSSSGPAAREDLICFETRNTLGIPNECLYYSIHEEFVNTINWQMVFKWTCILDLNGCTLEGQPLILHNYVDTYELGIDSATLRYLGYLLAPLIDGFSCNAQFCDPIDIVLTDYDRDGDIDGVAAQVFKSDIWIAVPLICDVNARIHGGIHGTMCWIP